MGKADFLERVRNARADLNNAISGITEDQMSQDIVAGDWTVKDILGHLASWQTEAALGIERAARGEAVDTLISESVDEWNAARVGERRRLPLVDVIEEFNAAYDRLLAALNASPDVRIPLGPAGWDETAELWWLTEHDSEHLETIQAYRKRLARA